MQESEMLNHTKPEIDKPPIGAVVSVLPEIDKQPSVCLHHAAKRFMCTIIPTEHRPFPDADGPWMLSCWGNGPGIVCFLTGWTGKPFRKVQVVAHSPKSVTAIPMPN